MPLDLSLLIIGVFMVLAALQLRLRWHSAQRTAGRNADPLAIDTDTRDPPATLRSSVSYSDVVLLDHWGSPEPD
jgi:hypothetical protein